MSPALNGFGGGSRGGAKSFGGGFGGDRGSYGGGGGYGGGGRNKGSNGDNLRKVKWDNYTLVRCHIKHFLSLSFAEQQRS